MNLLLDLFVLGWLLVLLGAFQAPAVLTAVIYGEDFFPYLFSMLVAFAAGFVLTRVTYTDDRRLRPRDGFLIVGLAWVIASLGGALPFVFTGALGPVDAWFESVAGFTTTGSSVMSGLERTDRALLLWRSMTQWVGGMGIILFTIAILPLLGIGGMQLFKAEVPGPVAHKVRPRIAETARRLWLIYVGFTALECALLWAAGMAFFDALNHSLTTLATGGFSTRDFSVGGFASPLVEWIVTLFMLIAGTNFVLHHRLLTGHVVRVWRDTELRYYLGMIAVATVITAAVLASSGMPVGQAVRLGAFQVVSLMTTTGFVTDNFELWPSVVHILFLLLMILGGMAGSTSGGVKSLRAILGVRALGAAVDRLVHPRAVRRVKYAGKPVDEEILAGIWAFFCAYFLLVAAAAFIIAAHGYDLDTSFSSALTAMGNVGPGLGDVGAYDNFMHYPAMVKVVLSLCMIAGRLEVFTLLVLLMPSYWRR
jgi:trk system potassium uptake protein TrkH